MKLATERLVRGIQSGRRIGPLGVDEEQIDRLVGSIRKRRLALSKEDPEVIRLRKSLEEALIFLKPDRKVLFDRQNIYVLPYPAFLAYAQKGDAGEEDAIVISQGALNTIAASIYDAYVQSLVPQSLQGVIVEQLSRNMSFDRLFANTLFLLRYRAYRYNEPLPDFSACLDEQAREHCTTAIQGAVTFLLMHEIGHLELGHFSRTTARAMQYELVVDQQLSDHQKQEAEADQYAIESLIPEAQAIGTYWMSQALSFFSSLELVSGERDDTHPMALNRAANSNIQRLKR